MPTSFDAGRWAAAILTVVLVGVVFVLAWLATGRSGFPSDPDNPLPWLESLSVIISFGIFAQLGLPGWSFPLLGGPVPPCETRRSAIRSKGMRDLTSQRGG